MSLQNDVQQAWMKAMKERSSDKDALALIRTELKNLAIATGARETGLSEADELKVIQKMAKQRRESIAAYEEAGRDDLVEKETLELRVIERFLPEQMDEATLKKKVEIVIEQLGATSMQDMGKVMGKVMAEVGGQADGRDVQRLVKAQLG